MSHDVISVAAIRFARELGGEKQDKIIGYLRWPPAAAWQRKSIWSQRTRCVQSRNTLISLVAFVALPAAFTRGSLCAHAKCIIYPDRREMPNASSRRASKARHSIVGLCIIVLDRSVHRIPRIAKESARRD